LDRGGDDQPIAFDENIRIEVSEDNNQNADDAGNEMW